GQLADLHLRLELGAFEEALAAGAVEAGVDPGDELDRLGDTDPARQHGDVGDEAHVAHQLVAFGARVAADHAHLALERDQPEHRLEGGGLAGAVGPDQTDDPAGRDLERGAVQRDLVLVDLAQLAGAHHGVGCGGGHGVHRAPPWAGAALSSSSVLSPRRRMRSSTSGHSSVRKRSRSLTSSFLAASSVTYMPRPLRFSTRASSANSW